MKLTKYEHACLVLEEQGQKLVIDPGEYTEELGDLQGIVAVVVTHAHDDHMSAEHLRKIVATNPEVKVLTTPEAAKAWGDPHAHGVTAGEEQIVGAFSLRFYGELHGAVHPAWPQAQNVGVLVNNRFYYPGDSLTIPDRKVEILAAPAAYAWLKVGEVIDFIQAINPRAFIRTHDGSLSDQGISTANDWFQKTSEKFGPTYNALDPGDSFEF
jgi:L-ascorbate metabolism protein UlaG (beta-lactamase superfamily)